jgi:hypothetical protein
MLRRWWPCDKSTVQGFRCDICTTVSAFWPVTGSNTNFKKVGLQLLIRARSTSLCTNLRSHENLRRRHAVSSYATLPTINATTRSYHLCYISVRNSPLQTKYFEKEGKESDYWGELKKNKVWWKSFKSVVKGSEVKRKPSKSVKKCSEVKWSEGKWSEVQRREGVKAGCNGKGIYGR